MEPLDSLWLRFDGKAYMCFLVIAIRGGILEPQPLTLLRSLSHTTPKNAVSNGTICYSPA